MLYLFISMLPVINCDVGAYFAFMSFPEHLFYLFSYLHGTYKFEIQILQNVLGRPPTIFPDSIMLVGAYW